MCTPTGFDSVTADSQLGCADLLHGLVFLLVVIKQRRRQRLQACRSDYQRAHNLPAIAPDSLLAAMQEFGCPGAPEVSGACSSPPFVAPLGCCGRGRAI